MNAPVLADTSISFATRDVRYVAVPLCVGLLLLGAVFNKEIVAAIQTWQASTAYNHCFLIVPIALYLLWDRRFDLVGVMAQPTPRVILLALPLALAWLVAERLGIMEGRQLAAMAFVELLFFLVLGKRLWWAMAGPLLYLFFLVPFGEFLTPRLQDATTFFIQHGLEIIGIPAYIDGYVIEIPQGAFFVAEACAGLRFLIASMAFGCLYALMMYRSPVRRAVFIVASMIVPIVANGFRGLGIVCLGYLMGSAQAAAADHVVYGWLFFSVVILLLIALGLPFRQDEMSTRSACGTAHATAGSASSRLSMPTRRVVAATFGLAIVAASMPALAAGLALATKVPVGMPVVVDPGPGCLTVSGVGTPPAERPVRTQRVVCGDVVMDLTWEVFSPHVTAAPVMAERRRLCARAETEGLQEEWLDTAGGPPSAWRLMRSNEPAFITAVAVWVDGKPVRPGLAMRGRMAMSSLFGSTHMPLVMTVTPVADWDKLPPTQREAKEDGLSAFLLSHPDLTAKVGTLTAVR